MTFSEYDSPAATPAAMMSSAGTSISGAIANSMPFFRPPSAVKRPGFGTGRGASIASTRTAERCSPTLSARRSSAAHVAKPGTKGTVPEAAGSPAPSGSPPARRTCSDHRSMSSRTSPMVRSRSGTAMLSTLATGDGASSP